MRGRVHRGPGPASSLSSVRVTRWVSSPGLLPNSLWQVRAFMSWFEWLSSTPLGRPVVPAV